MKLNLTRLAWALHVLVLLVLSACGSRSSLRDKYAPPTPPPPDVPSVDVVRFDAVDVMRADMVEVDVRATVDVACPAPSRSTQSLTAMLEGMARSNVGRPMTFQWELLRQPMDSRAMLQNSTSATTTITYDLGGEYRFRFTARDDLGNMASCETRADVESAIDLLCPNDQSNFQGAVVMLTARARSRLGRAVTVRWETVSRPAMSRTDANPPTSTDATLLLDSLGDWRLRLVAVDAMGQMASCVTNVHADPDVLVTCPSDTTSRPFLTAMLNARAESRTRRPLTYRWEIIEAPITSTARLSSTNTLGTSFTFDVAGNWTYRFTATNDIGNMAFCTTRALSTSEEAIRVEIVWNTDRATPNCNPDRPDGNDCGDIDLHLANFAIARGRWADSAGMNGDCYYANCRCGMPGMVCTDPMAIEWEPPGTPNNPQLDIDHTADLPGPENINVVRAEPGLQLDLGVHVYSLRSIQSTPVVARVYCAGAVVFESEPVRLSGRQGSPADGDMWLVGRIETIAGGCRFTRCGRPGDLGACIRPQNRWGM